MLDKIKNGQYWKGSPAVKSGRVNHPWPDERPPRRSHWVPVYGLTALLLGALPLLAVASGLAVIGLAIRHTQRLSHAVLPALLWTPVAAVTAFTAYALLTVAAVRILSFGLREGYHPVRSRTGWQLWATERLMDAARNYLFPLYASMLTPMWLRLLGAQVGSGTEISTALLIPKFTVIEDGAFLADDTMVASYELGGGWIYAAKTTVGRRAFLGNSGITQPGRRVPDDGLVAVLSATPPKAKRRFVVVGQPADAVAPAPRRGRRGDHIPAAAEVESDAGGGGDVPVAAGDRDGRDRVGDAGHIAGAGKNIRHLVGGTMRRTGAFGNGCDGGSHHGCGEMACGWPDQGE